MAEAPIACDLGALQPAERLRRAELSARIRSRVGRVEELPDGYVLELEGAPSLAGEALEWLLLERRCCPFLDLELALPARGGALRLALRGGPGVKEFLSTAGLAEQRAAHAACGGS